MTRPEAAVAPGGVSTLTPDVLGFFESLEESLPVVSEPVRFVLPTATLEVIGCSCRHSNHM